ncbi:ABC transporter ATP-binding protein [Ruminococcus flavefaciens]|uniref:ABC transporter ATP-binding protein n=1 Tax=Ruminococcus flavefaciens TaxID=1265 RepID=UPI00048E8629|nr:ABC transporter ATP-binding protein [Ruminococcus flavefaciens]
MNKKSVALKQFEHKNLFNKYMTYILLTFETLSEIALGFFVKEFVDVAIKKDEKAIHDIIILFIFYIIFVSIVFIMRNYFKEKYITKAIIQYKRYFFARLMEKNISFIKQYNISNVLSTLTNDTNTIEVKYLLGSFTIYKFSLLIVMSLISMIYLNVLVTLVVIGSCLIPVLITAFIGKKVVLAEKKVSNANMSFVGYLKNILNGFSTIKSYTVEQEIVSIYDDKCNNTERIKMFSRLLLDSMSCVSYISSYLIYLLVFGIGAYLTLRDILTLGVMIGMVQLLASLISPVQRIGGLVADKRAAMALIEKNEKILDMCTPKTQNTVTGRFNDHISFENINLSVEDDNKILKDITLDIKYGKSYIIVGESGSGKTSLINMLLGYYSDYTGKISIDGVDIKDISFDSLYNLISVVEQNVFVFDDTIKNNITMYQDYSDEEYRNAVKVSGLEKLIEKAGNDYICGENGKNLSGGEKQRISIARSILRQSRLLIMDEPTSALDQINTMNIQDYIMKIQGVTRIIITHHIIPEVFSQSDYVIVMKNGTIREFDTYEKLISKKEYFYHNFYIRNNRENDNKKGDTYCGSTQDT